MHFDILSSINSPLYWFLLATISPISILIYFPLAFGGNLSVYFGLLKEAWVRDYLQDHRQLSNDYTDEKIYTSPNNH